MTGGTEASTHNFELHTDVTFQKSLFDLIQSQKTFMLKVMNESRTFVTYLHKRLEINP